MSNFNLQVEDDLWRKFKVKCAVLGRPMKDVLVNLIHQFVDGEQKKNERRVTK
jgi:hypothetical protein